MRNTPHTDVQEYVVAGPPVREAAPRPHDPPGDTVFATHPDVIRPATHADSAELHRLAALDSQRPLAGRILVALIDGRPAAALSLTDGRAVADPFRPTAQLLVRLRLRAQAVKAYEATPSLADRMRAAMPTYA
jgi:hypothetical protein